MSCENVIIRLKALYDPKNIEGMKRFGINSDNAYGISTPDLKSIANEIGKNHELALELWNTGIREARIIAGLIDEPSKVKEEQMDQWVNDFNSWDVCDSICMALFDRTPFVYSKINQWCEAEKEYVKRAGFVLMACLAVHDKKAKDEIFMEFLQKIIKKSDDGRNFVKKAVNWALRQIGKRNFNLNGYAIDTANKILAAGSKSGKWIASDALRELKNEKIQKRIAGKK